MCRKLICLASFVVPVLSLISNAQAVEPTADAYIRGAANGDTNYGGDAQLLIKNNNGAANDRKAYIRFDIAGTTAEASLDLTVSGNNEGGGGTTPQTFTVEVYGLAESLDHTWTENDITWNNAPANDTSNHNFTADATLLGSFIVAQTPAGETVSFSDPALVDFINNDTDNQITLLFRRTAGNGSHNLGFASKENTSYSAPTLNVKVASQASGPNPADEATDVPRDVVLGWTPGEFAPPVNGHIVYLSDNFSDVNDGIGGITQDANSYAPFPRLDLGTTYYWRVDEVNAPPDSTIYPGKVWSFTVEPVAYLIDGANITATASSSLAGSSPQKTVDGSGLDDSDLHSTDIGDMWLSDLLGPQPTWIEYQFDRVCKLHEMVVWNQNQVIEPAIGYGFQDVTIEYSVDGIAYTTLGTTHEFARGPGAVGYAANTTVDFGGAVAKYVKLTPNSNWGGILTQYGLSEVRFFSIPVLAREPSPASGATDAGVDAVLSFRAGREADKHEVYLSTDEQAVIDGTAPVVSVTEPSYAVALDLASTYYWRIDEVNDTETPATWEGDIWNLSTPEDIVVDDFESYNDIPSGQEGSHLVYETWADGYGTTANGSTIGYTIPFEPTTETSTVYDGSQSVPLSYDNTVATYSEVTASVADLQAGQDWSKYGIKGLTLRFYGDPNNVPQQMYAKVNGTKVTYDGNAENIRLKGWQMWYIDLASLGVNLSNVTTLTIGFERIGTLGGQGMVLLDGIRLYAYDRPLIMAVDPGTAGLQAQYPFEGNTNDSSGNARNGTAMGGPLFVAGKVGQAIGLDGIDDYVNIDGYKGVLADASAVQQPFTITAWVKTTDSGDRTITSWGTNSNSLRVDFRLYQGRLRVEHGGGNVQADTTLSDDNWHHVALTMIQGATVSYPDVQLWLDGKDDTTASTDPDVFSITAGVDMAIGYRATAADRYFLGAIDDVRLYDRVLTQEEIAWLASRMLPFDKPF